MTTPSLDTGAARVRLRHRVGRKVHAMRPPLGHGLVCDPAIDIDRLVATDDPIDCGVCLSRMKNDKRG